jgi:hypothetical protein
LIPINSFAMREPISQSGKDPEGTSVTIEVPAELTPVNLAQPRAPTLRAVALCDALDAKRQ